MGQKDIWNLNANRGCMIGYNLKSLRERVKEKDKENWRKKTCSSKANLGKGKWSQKP